MDANDDIQAGYAALDIALESKSEAINIDYRRRWDQMYGVLVIAPTTWKRIDYMALRQKGLFSDKWRKVSGFAFLLGVALTWWLSELKVPYNVGIFVVLYGGIIFVVTNVEQSNLASEMSTLLLRQEDLLCRWLASGASESDFFERRNWVREDEELNNADNAGVYHPAHADWKKKREQLDQRRAETWLKTKRSLIDCAIGKGVARY